MNAPEFTNRESFIRYLDKIKHLYPAGIPKSVLEAPLMAGETRQSVLFFVASGAEEVTEGDKALVDSIITNGLKLPREEAQVIFVSPHEGGEWMALFTGSLVKYSPRIAIVMGLEPDQEGLWSEISGVPTLSTLSLREVADSRESKRVFWGHLKEALQRFA